MPRAIIYPHLAHSSGAGEYRPTYGRADSGAASTQTDDYLARLGKHVPGEALSVFLVITTGGDVSETILAIAIVVITVVAVIYRHNRNAQLPQREQANGVVYDVFTIVAFLAWALGTSAQTQHLIGLDARDAVVLMALVAFALPAIDDAVGRKLGKS